MREEPRKASGLNPEASLFKRAERIQRSGGKSLPVSVSGEAGFPPVSPFSSEEVTCSPLEVASSVIPGSQEGSVSLAQSLEVARGDEAVTGLPPSKVVEKADVRPGSPSEDGSSPSSLDYYVISGRKANSYLATSLHNKELDKNRKVRRFYQRCFTGVGVGGRLRILSLTTSDEAKARGYDIHRNFRVLVKRLRRRWGRFEYIGVKEVKGDRLHLHLLFRGEYMEQAQIEAMWAKLHASPVVDIRAVYSQRGGVRYLAKYLAEQALSRYWASYGWVFRGWVGWSKRVKRALGHYPSKALLQSLARLDVIKRRLAIDFFEGKYPRLWAYTLERAI